MWLFFVVAWFVLLAAIAILAQQAFGYDVAHLPALFAGLPMPQRIATGAIVALGAGADRRPRLAALASGSPPQHAARPPQEDPRGCRRRPRPAKPPRRHRPAPDRKRSPRGRLRPPRQAGRDRAARPAPAGPQRIHRHARPARRDPPPPAGAARDGRQGRRPAARGRACFHRDPRPPEPARTLPARPRDRRPQEQPRRPPEGRRARRIGAAVTGERGPGHLRDPQPVQGRSGEIPCRAGRRCARRTPASMP